MYPVKDSVATGGPRNRGNWCSQLLAFLLLNSPSHFVILFPLERTSSFVKSFKDLLYSGTLSTHLRLIHSSDNYVVPTVPSSQYRGEGTQMKKSGFLPHRSSLSTEKVDI